MPEYRILRRTAPNDEIILPRVRLAVSYWDHLAGLQFVRHLPADEGLLFVTNFEGRAHTAIHMFFMFFDIAVIWLNRDGVVVDKQLAKTWRPAYAPRANAQYYLEANTELLERVNIGDVLRFDEPVED
jgi:uncharacterized membrane protein (UPF0127 family)